MQSAAPALLLCGEGCVCVVRARTWAQGMHRRKKRCIGTRARGTDVPVDPIFDHVAAVRDLTAIILDKTTIAFRLRRLGHHFPPLLRHGERALNLPLELAFARVVKDKLVDEDPVAERLDLALENLGLRQRR